MLTAIFFSILVCLPGLFNLFVLPKQVYLSTLAVLALLDLRGQDAAAREYAPAVWLNPPPLRFPLAYLTVPYFALILVSGKNALNWFTFVNQAGIDLMSLVFFYWAANFVSRETFRQSIRWLMVFAVFMSLTAFYADWIPNFNGVAEGRGGTQGNPSFAGLILGICIIAALAYNRWHYLLAYLPHLWLTGSLATFVGLCGGLAFLLAARLAQANGWSLGRIVTRWCVAMAGALALAYPWLPVNASLSIRAHTWAAGFGMARDFPVFGVGRGQSTLIWPPYAIAYIGPSISAIHNDFLQIWYEAGPIALALFLAVLGMTARRAWARIGAGDYEATVIAAMMGPCLSHLMFNFVLEMPEQAVIFWALLGVTWNLQDAKR